MRRDTRNRFKGAANERHRAALEDKTTGAGETLERVEIALAALRTPINEGVNEMEGLTRGCPA
jgi:hypothetical protein